MLGKLSDRIVSMEDGSTSINQLKNEVDIIAAATSKLSMHVCYPEHQEENLENQTRRSNLFFYKILDTQGKL